MAAAARPAVLLLLLGIASPRGTRAQTCQTCTDVRSSYMITNNLDCATWGGLWGKCSNDADWTSNLYCEYSCDVVHNFGYHVEPCCRLSPPPATPPPPLTPYHNQGYANLIFVDAANGDDNNDGSWYAPVQTLYRATNLVTDSTAVYVLDGTYYNRNYGTGAVDNAAAMNLNGFTDVLITNLPGHAPRIVFDGSGGISARNVVNFRVSGFEIDGPNQQITRWQANQNRLLQDAKFSGRGIAVWSGSHIHIHDNVVHNCPNSGIRANEADYVTIEDNVVSNCTWWSSNAESGIVLADCAHVDTLDVVKLVIRRNTVHDNVNQIPYYNRNYDNATYMAQNQFSVVREHYGTSLQTFIIDGSGVYVTRNSASYLHGRVQLSDNVAYRNGINGLVVHKTDRAIVENNRVTNNGVVSKLAPELRQSYAGLVFNQASHVRSLSNNYVSAPFADDYAFVLDDASSFASEFVAGSNYVCVGGVSTSLSHLVAASDFCSPSPPSPPAPPPCTVCTDTSPNAGQQCAGWTWAMNNRCNRNSNWVANRYCEISCEAAGVGYEGWCCPPPPASPPPSPPPCTVCTDTSPTAGQQCAGWTWGMDNQCNRNSNWVANRYCEISCEAAGVGYEGWCCPPPPPPPSPPPPSPLSPPSPPLSPPPCFECTDTRSSSMITNNQYCDTWSYAWTNKCNSDSYWQASRYCELSCLANGNGYDGECCPPPPPPSPPPCAACTDTRSSSMITNNQYCDTWSYAWTNKCNSDSYWQASRYCELSCLANGNGYDNPPCCPPSPPAAPPPCIECTDTRSSSMITNNQYCDTWSYAWTNKCNSDSYWQASRYCELSCEANGNGYGNCCPPPPPASPPPCTVCTDTSPTAGQQCAGWTWGMDNQCNRNSNWVANRYCEISCEAAGVGYEGWCCPSPPSLPTRVDPDPGPDPPVPDGILPSPPPSSPPAPPSPSWPDQNVEIGEPSSDSGAAGAIVGGVLGGLFSVVAVVLGVGYYKARGKKKGSSSRASAESTAVAVNVAAVKSPGTDFSNIYSSPSEE